MIADGYRVKRRKAYEKTKQTEGLQHGIRTNQRDKKRYWHIQA